MDILSVLNAAPMYLISGVIILTVVAVCILFMVRAYRAGIRMNMSKEKLNKTILSSATFTVLPSISILLGVIALSGTLGVPLPWLRLSVIGALHYETSVADIAARSVGLSGLNVMEMTKTSFLTIALLMSAGIIWGMVCMVIFGKGYLKKLQSPKKPTPNNEKKSAGFGDFAMTAMFIGLISAYIGSYVGTFTSTGDWMPLLVMAVSALAMAGFLYLVEKKKQTHLESFSIAGSMLIAMATAVGLGLIL